MKKPIIQVLIAGALAVLAISVTAFAHHVSKLPEQAFINKLSIPQLELSSTGCDDFTCVLIEIKSQTQNFLDKEITWTSERGDIVLTPNDLNITPQTEKIETILNNFMIGTSKQEKLMIYLFGGKISYDLKTDETLLKAAFADSNIEQGTKSATYYYSNGQVQIDPEQIGYGIDTTTLSEQIQDYWLEFQTPETAPLPLLTSEPEIRNETLESLLSQAQETAALSITLLGEWGATWDLNLWEHIDLILPGEEQNFVIDPTPLNTYIDTELSETVEEEPEPVTITENEYGNYLFDGSARFGKSILRDEFLTLLQNAIANSDDSDITIPIETTMPEVTVPESLSERGITDLLEFGYTSFSGSPYNRIYNIGVGMDIFNSTIIPQGEEFSFTALLGPVDGAHGWREELVIKGDETKPEYGGGLCQVSSTMYRAALYVGLPITYRQEHSYAVSYYAYPNGYGLDATVYQPLPDLRFINDTPGDILVQGYTDGALAYFVMYGTNDGRSVQMEGPSYHSYVSPGEAVTIYTDELEPGVREFEEYAHTGFQVEWYRTITYGDGTPGERENIHTYYEARPEKWLEGNPEEEKVEETLEED